MSAKKSIIIGTSCSCKAIILSYKFEYTMLNDFEKLGLPNYFEMTHYLVYNNSTSVL